MLFILLTNEEDKQYLLLLIYMSEEPVSIPKPVYRLARLEDFFDEDSDKPIKNKQNYNENYSHNDSNTISKNQQEFGHKKRIKP